MASDAEKIAELNAIVAAVRERVRNGYPPEGDSAATDGEPGNQPPPVRVALADLMPLVRARDAAQAKIAAIGGVNPRAGGLLNQLVQALKKLIARVLQWFVRDQVVFNRETVTAMEAVIEAFDEQNRVLLSLCSQVNERLAPLYPLAALVPQMKADFSADLRAGLDEQSRALASVDDHANALSAETNERLKVLSVQLAEQLVALSGTTGMQLSLFGDRLSGLSTKMTKTDERIKDLSAQSDERIGVLSAQSDERIKDLSLQTDVRIRGLSVQTDERINIVSAQMGERINIMSAQNDERIKDLSVQNDERLTALHSFTGETRETLLAEARELKDVRKHWIEWRAQWEQNVATNEIQFLRAAADLQSAFQHRVSLIEANFREMVQAQHRDYLGALDRANIDIQKRLWADLEKVRETYERMIHSELRLIRLRSGGTGLGAQGIQPAMSSGQNASPVLASTPTFDYSRFAERFRGADQQIRRNMEFYKPFFASHDRVLDIGCGRGEFLEVMREAGVAAQGIDLSPESVAQCRDKGLQAEVADLFVYLANQPDGEFDGILSSQVVEHLPPDRLPEMIGLCAAKLRRGGVLALETPNPECLAIFATYFYLDPTHTRPMPHEFLQFCMEEAGLAGMEVHRLAPAIDSIPELASLPVDFRERLFGGMDYAIIGRKI